MADNRVKLLPTNVYVKMEVPKVSARVEDHQVLVNPPEPKELPVLVTKGPPGPPGKDGAVVGGAIIDDGLPSTDRVWSSQHTHDNDVAVVDSLTPDVDLVLLFDNALT